jgi:hypothetical protein
VEAEFPLRLGAGEAVSWRYKFRASWLKEPRREHGLELYLDCGVYNVEVSKLLEKVPGLEASHSRAEIPGA